MPRGWRIIEDIVGGAAPSPVQDASGSGPLGAQTKTLFATI
jgi:hypothetical protein